MTADAAGLQMLDEAKVINRVAEMFLSAKSSFPWTPQRVRELGGPGAGPVADRMEALLGPLAEHNERLIA